jgi:NADPH:quinone reductase-like Zn-dependent oxidoreductase
MGIIEKVGAGVTSFKEGQRVTALGWRAIEGSGSWQQYVTLKEELLVRPRYRYLA